jgi:hypothetical protein
MAVLPKGLGTVQDLIKRVGEARKRWELWRSLYQEAMDFAAPERETFHNKSPGQRKNRHIFDSTAILGLEQFASRLQGSMVPSWQQWMDLKSGSKIKEEDKKRTDALLEEITTIFFDNLNHSNFSTEITPAFSDLGIGTGAIMIEEGRFENDEMFKFTNIPLAELYPERDLKTVWREQKVEARLIKQLWPNADLTPKLEKIAKDKTFTKIKIINGIVFNTEDRTYNHVIIHEAEKALLFTQAFETQRLIVFRWHLTPGEVFGRGPILQVLPDIRTANKVKQFILENGAIQMAGMYTGLDDGMFNPHTVRIAPGTVIPVNQNGTQNPSLQALPRSGDLGLGDLILSDLQNNIKKALFVEPLGDITDPVRSATEVQIRNQEMLKQAGASLGRLKTELIEKIVAAGIDILSGRGVIPKELKVDGKEISIKQSSPLAKAEDLEDFQNSQIWFSNVSQLGQLVGPEVILGTVKVEDLSGYWAEKLGVPSKLSRTKDETAQAGKLMMKMAQSQQQGGEGEGV